MPAHCTKRPVINIIKPVADKAIICNVMILSVLFTLLFSDQHFSQFSKDSAKNGNVQILEAESCENFATISNFQTCFLNTQTLVLQNGFCMDRSYAWDIYSEENKVGMGFSTKLLLNIHNHLYSGIIQHLKQNVNGLLRPHDLNVGVVRGEGKKGN